MHRSHTSMDLFRGIIIFTFIRNSGWCQMSNGQSIWVDATHEGSQKHSIMCPVQYSISEGFIASCSVENIWISVFDLTLCASSAIDLNMRLNMQHWQAGIHVYANFRLKRSRSHGSVRCLCYPESIERANVGMASSILGRCVNQAQAELGNFIMMSQRTQLRIEGNRGDKWFRVRKDMFM